MIDIMRQAAESIHDFLKFTGEVAKDGKSIPVLDTQMWVGSTGESHQEWCKEWKEPSNHEELRGEKMTPRATVWYSFYKKPMSSRLGIINRSAVPEKTKVTTATDEILRRLKNTHTRLGREKVEEILVQYMDDLQGMGYPHQWRKNVLEAAVRGYLKIPDDKIHRHGASTALARRKRKSTPRIGAVERAKREKEHQRQK